MKNIIYLLIILIVTNANCQIRDKALTKKLDYSFLTDSLNIDQQLEKYKLVGFSVVVFENYEIVYSKQFGMKSVDSKDKIDQNTAFSTASISKPITALLCFMLEEKGLINLDDPIDNFLKRWHLPKVSLLKIIVQHGDNF